MSHSSDDEKETTSPSFAQGHSGAEEAEEASLSGTGDVVENENTDNLTEEKERVDPAIAVEGDTAFKNNESSFTQRPCRLASIKQEELQQQQQQWRQQQQQKERLSPLSSHKQPAGRAFFIANNDSLLSSLHSEPGAFTVTATPSTDVEAPPPPEAEHDPTETAVVDDSESSLLLTAELVDESALAVEVQRLRRLEEEYQSKISTVTVAVALEDKDADEQPVVLAAKDSMTKSKRRLLQTVAGLLVTVAVAAIIMVLSLSSKIRGGEAGLPPNGPNDEQRQILKQAGLANFTDWMDKLGLWEELATNEAFASSPVTILAFSDDALDGFMQENDGLAYFQFQEYEQHARQLLLHHMVAESMMDIRGNVRLSMSDTTNVTMLSGEQVQVDLIPTDENMGQPDLVWTPSGGSVNTSAVALAPEVLVFEQGEHNVAIYALADNRALLPRFVRFAGMDREVYTQHDASLVLDILEFVGILPGLTSSLHNCTILAPSNAAFEKLPDYVLSSLLSEPTTQEEFNFVYDLVGIHGIGNKVLQWPDERALITNSWSGKILEIGKNGVLNLENGIIALQKTTDIHVNFAMLHVVDSILLAESSYAFLADIFD